MKITAKHLIVQLITGVRIPLGISVFLILSPDGISLHKFIIVAILIGLMEITDLLDGFLARKLGVISNFGKYFDPFCDSLGRLFVYGGLLQMKIIEPWLFWILIGRDISLGTIYTVFYLKKKPLDIRLSGKIKAWVHGAGALLLVGFAIIQQAYQLNTGTIQDIQLVISLVIALSTVISLADYIRYILFKTTAKQRATL